MKIETLKKSKFKYFLYALVLGVLLLVLLDLKESLAKYKVTESINIAKGTINYSPSDLEIVAIYVVEIADILQVILFLKGIMNSIQQVAIVK